MALSVTIMGKYGFEEFLDSVKLKCVKLRKKDKFLLNIIFIYVIKIKRDYVFT